MKFGVEGSAMFASPGISIFFVISFVFLVIFTLLNMFTVILEKNYTKATEAIEEESTSKGVSNAKYGLQSLWLDAFKLPSLHIIPSRKQGNISKHYTENGSDGLGRGGGGGRAQPLDSFEFPPSEVVSQENVQNESGDACGDASGVEMDHERHLFLYVGSTLALEMYRNDKSNEFEENKERHAVLAIHDSGDRVTALNMLRTDDELDIEWPEKWRAHNMGASLKVVKVKEPFICTTARMHAGKTHELTLHIFELVLVPPKGGTKEEQCSPEEVSLENVDVEGGGRGCKPQTKISYVLEYTLSAGVCALSGL